MINQGRDNKVLLTFRLDRIHHIQESGVGFVLSPVSNTTALGKAYRDFHWFGHLDLAQYTIIFNNSLTTTTYSVPGSYSTTNRCSSRSTPGLNIAPSASKNDPVYDSDGHTWHSSRTVINE